MKTFFSALVLCALTSSAMASIGPIAMPASAVLEQAAILQHSHTHDTYETSFGSHGLETAAVAMAADLILWDAGSVPESQIFADVVALDNAFLNYTQTITAAGVLNQGDALVDLYHKVITNMYLRLSYGLQNVSPF